MVYKALLRLYGYLNGWSLFEWHTQQSASCSDLNLKEGGSVPERRQSLGSLLRDGNGTTILTTIANFAI